MAFGDNVRVRTVDVTTRAGLAGLVGQFRGETTPSVTGVSVIGGSHDDYAINVFFEGRAGDFWFSSDLLELVDHAPGTVLRSGDATWTRNASGEWVEEGAPEDDVP